MKVKIKKLHPNAVIPSYAKDGDAGLDLTACEVGIAYRRAKKDDGTFWNEPFSVKVGFGIAMEIPKGYVGLIFPRSSICNTDCRLSNCVGVIDSGYRGEITTVFDVTPYHFFDRDGKGIYREGERCAQMIIMPYPHIELEEVDDLSESDRGTGGYGSTNEKRLCITCAHYRNATHNKPCSSCVIRTHSNWEKGN